MKTHLLHIILAAVLLMGTGCAGEKKTPRTSERQSSVLHVAVMPTMDCLPIYVAQQLNLFDKQQLRVRLHSFQAQLDVDTALINGSVQAAVSDLVRTERLQKQGIPLTYVAATNARWQLLAAQTARIKATKQLGDKNLAMTRFSATDLLTDLVVKKGKPSNPVYRIQVNDVNIRLKMLNNRQVDAAWFTEPQATAARLAKGIVIADSKDEDLELGVIAFRTSNSREKGKKSQATAASQADVDAFVKAYNEATDSIRKYGVKNYAARFQQQLRIDRKTVDALPDIIYTHAAKPQEKALDAAKKHIHP